MVRKEYTCSECGQTGFKSPAGLRGHRQFKHGVAPSSPQLPLAQQDLLVTESKLEQRLTELEQQLGFSPNKLEQRLGIAARPITKIVLQHTKELKEHIEQLKAARKELAEAMQKAAELNADQIALAQALGADMYLLLLAIERHSHPKSGGLTFSLPDELRERLTNALKQAGEWELKEVIVSMFERHKPRANIATLDNTSRKEPR